MKGAPSVSNAAAASLYQPVGLSSQRSASNLTTALQEAKNTADSAGPSQPPPAMRAAPGSNSPSRSQTGFPVSTLLEHVKSLAQSAMLQQPEQMADSILVETVALFTWGTGALLSSVLDPQNVNKLVQAVIKIKNEEMKAKAMAYFVPEMRYLSEEARKLLCVATINIKNNEQKIDLLSKFARGIKSLNPEERFLILTIAGSMSNELSRARVLAHVSLADLTDDERKQVVQTALAIENEEAQVLVLTTLFSNLSHLPPASKSAVIEAATRIKPALRAEVLTGLRAEENLNEQEGTTLLTAAEGITDEVSRTRALAILAAELTCLKPELRQNLISGALAIADEKKWFITACSLVPRMKSLNLLQLRSALFNKMCQIQHKSLRSSALAMVALQAVYLDNIQHFGLMALTKRIQNEKSRTDVLRNLIGQSSNPNLDKELLREIFEESLSITDEESKVALIMALASKLNVLPEDLRRKVIEATLGCADEDKRRIALYGLAASADCLNEEEGKLFLQAVTAFSDRKVQAWLFDAALAAINRAG